MNEQKDRLTPEKQDKAKDKKRLKKAFVIIASVLLALFLISLAAERITDLLRQKNSDDTASRLAEEESGNEFFEPDYEENILEDELYLSLDRRIMFTRYGEQTELIFSTAEQKGAAAKMFCEYFNCIIRGDYSEYPRFFTEKYKNDRNADIPERFTMQKLYDIGVSLFDSTADPDNGVLKEIYEVRYRIFENNGTFRRDIKSMETRTLVFEVYISDGIALINSVGFRKNA